MNTSPPLPADPPQISVQQKTSKAAVFSLILGILSNLCLWVLGSIPAIILGIVAIKNINRNPAEVGGKGLAIAGIITGCSGLIVGTVAFSMVFIGAEAYKKGAGRAKCMLQMATVQKLVLTHANLESLNPGDPISTDILVSGGYLEQIPLCPDGGQYTFLNKVPDVTTSYIQCDVEGHVLDLSR